MLFTYDTSAGFFFFFFPLNTIFFSWFVHLLFCPSLLIAAPPFILLFHVFHFEPLQDDMRFMDFEIGEMLSNLIHERF